MKKIVALCLSMIMALSMASFSVMAEDAAPFSEIANGQPANFVTGDLDLGSHSIESSDEDVISNDGIVTRPLAVDKTVSISIDGGEAVDVLVKSKLVEEKYVEDFSTDDIILHENDKDMESIYTEWRIVGESQSATTVENGVLKADIVNITARTNVYFYIPAMDNSKTVTIKFDVDNITNLAASGVDIRMAGTVTYDGGNTKPFPASSVARMAAESGFTSTFWSGAKKSLEFTYDPVTGEVWMNGVLSSKNLYDFVGVENGETIKFSTMYFCNAAGGCTGTFDVDNFAVYQTKAVEDVLVEANPDEKAEYFAKYISEEYIANGANLSNLKSDLMFEAEEDLSAYGVEIEWSSSDDKVITNDGKVLRDLYDTKTATVTGAIKVDGEVVMEASYDVVVLPLSIASASEVLTADEGEAGDSVIGTEGWNASLNLPYESVEIKEDDGGKFYRFAANAYQPTGTAPGYTFKTVPTMDGADTYVAEFKVRIPEKGGLANWTFFLNGLEMAEFIYYNGYLYDNDYPLGSDDYHGAGSARSDVAVTAGQWYNLRMEISKDSVVDCFINDKLVGSHATAKTIPTDIVMARLIFKGRYNCDANNDSATMVKYCFDLDDVKLYTTGSIDSAMADYDDETKVKYYKEYILKEGIVNPAESYLAVESDLNFVTPAPESGVSIEWTSDSDAVKADGKVIRPDSPVSEKANITATITAGDVSDTVSFAVRIAPAGTVKVPANLASMDFEDASGRPAISNSEYAVDEDTESTVLHMYQEEVKQKNQDIAISNLGLDAVGFYDRFVVSADVKYSRVEGITGNTGGLIIKGIAGQETLAIRLSYGTKKISVMTSGAVANAAATAVEKKTNTTLYFDMPEEIANSEGEWLTFTIDHNVLSQTYDIYIDGVRINEAPILRAATHVPDTKASLLRAVSLQLSGAGDISMDNVTALKYADKDVNEVHAALNVASYIHAGEAVYPSLISQDNLLTKTIDKSFVNNYAYVVNDEDPIANPGRFTFTTAEDAPVISYKVNGKPVTSINVGDKTSYMTIEVTATKGDISVSRTMVRNAAPITVKNICWGGGYNGLWLEGDVKGTETILIACYNGKKLAAIKKIQLTEENYDPATGLVKDFSVVLPWSENSGYNSIRTFIYGANGIEPITFEAPSINN